MPRNFRFKPSISDTKRANLATMELYAHDGMSEAGRQHLEHMRATTKPKRVRGPRKPSAIPTESETQRAIIAFLCVHPKVALVIRFNSGAVQSDKYYVEFSHIYSRGFDGEKMRLPDIYALLRNGRTLWIEVKREGWTKPTDTREQEQANFLAHVRACNGYGIFATSINDVDRGINGLV